MKDICHESDREKMKEIKEEKPFQFPTLSRAPRLSIFIGESTTKENEVNYELWKYEVECLCKTDIPSSYIHEAIRHSLEGETGLIIMKMGHDVDIGNILGKLDSIYGAIDKKETIFAEFSSAKQRKNGPWRLEDILSRAIKHQQIHHRDANEMFKNMLWT